MFSSSFRSLLVALVTYAAVVSAAPAVSTAPSLTVKTSGPDVNVDGLNSLKVITTITNTGDETLKLLNDPRGVLSPFPENAFAVTDPSGSRLPFGDAPVNSNSSLAADLDPPNTFTVLAPGHSINVTHDLSAVYDFVQPSTGDYSIEPTNLFTYVDANGTPKALYATVEGIAKVKVSGNRLAVRLPFKGKGKGKSKSKSKGKGKGKTATFDDCSDREQAIIIAAAEAAEGVIAEAYSYIKDLEGPTERYTTWYGAYDKTRLESVQWHWEAMSTNTRTRLSTLDYSCVCGEVAPDPEGLETAAWVNPSVLLIRICPPFWKMNPGRKALTLVHESSHFWDSGLSEDFKYGEEGCKQLAKDNPDKAIANADNIKFFARNEEGLE